ncbi:hypothetical protein ACFL0T_06430 [Candidatus Omnitrophota bacterium]
MRKILLSKRGMIPVVLTFAVIFSLVIAATLRIFWTKAPLTVNNLKRHVALNYAEAALYETFNRFRRTDQPFDEWDPATWPPSNANVYRTYNSPNGHIYTLMRNNGGWEPVVVIRDPNGNDVFVVIDVIQDAATGRFRVTATVDYNGITL